MSTLPIVLPYLLNRGCLTTGQNLNCIMMLHLTARLIQYKEGEIKFYNIPYDTLLLVGK